MRGQKLITMEPISVQDLRASHEYPDCGGVCSFEGVVRNHHEGCSVERLFYEAYESMAEKVLSELQSEIIKEYPGCYIRAIHRHGELNIGDVAVAIVVWAPHRSEAFRACEDMINRIKKRVPIWKKEFYTNGETKWVRCHHN